MVCWSNLQCQFQGFLQISLKILTEDTESSNISQCNRRRHQHKSSKRIHSKYFDSCAIMIYHSRSRLKLNFHLVKKRSNQRWHEFVTKEYSPSLNILCMLLKYILWQRDKTQVPKILIIISKSKKYSMLHSLSIFGR